MVALRKGPRPTKDPKPIFQGLVIAIAGSLGETWTDANLSRWISLRKGSLVHQMDASVTHLVCTQDEVKNKTPKVREAMKRGSKHCKIVSKDWLEDSMHADRRLTEGLFSPMNAIRKENKKQMRDKQAAKGIEQAKKTVDANYFHHYMDGTYFTYVVTLTRNDEALGAFGERYVLFLEESNAEPHLYLFFAKYYKSKGNTHAHIHRPNDTPGRFEDHFEAFKSFFQTKTGIPWEERLIKAGTTEKRFFQYTPPAGGKPVGWVPPGCEKPDLPEPLPQQPQPQQPQSEAEEDLPEPANLEILQGPTQNAVEKELQAAGLLSVGEMVLSPPPNPPSGNPLPPSQGDQETTYPLLEQYLVNLPIRLKQQAPNLSPSLNSSPPPPTCISSNTMSSDNIETDYSNDSFSSVKITASNEMTVDNNAATATATTKPTPFHQTQNPTHGPTWQQSDQNQKVVIIID